jgi:predicted GH43/DUF377 family glycosyl hydrolase
MTAAAPVTAIRQDLRLEPDLARVVTRLFVAGQEVVGGSDSRASSVVARLLALSEDDVQAQVDELLVRFGGRHTDLVSTFSHHADRIANRIPPEAELSEERWLLLGATFTHEYAVEGASLCNPSIVAHPDQEGAPLGGLRVVLSVRGIGEGHLSTIGFRTGTVTYEGLLEIDAPGPHPVLGTVDPGVLDREAFHGHLRARGADGESAAFVLDQLGPTFTAEELDVRLGLLADQRDTRRNARSIADALRSIAAGTYTAHFPVDTALSERVLWPAIAAEARGMEDARFVRFVDADGSATYLATYTAFNGTDVSQHLLRTDDFLRFESSSVSGPAALGKGLALFPRQIDGRYAALSRHDRERNSVALSESLDHWGRSVPVQVPRWGWELLQLGNCGSPIETDDGWLVLTHGVGPMRTYSIGALLLDLEDPTLVLSATTEPLLSPEPDEQDGYVPNVVYTCGALLHGDALVIPYAIGDRSISVATVSCAELLGSMTPFASVGVGHRI